MRLSTAGAWSNFSNQNTLYASGAYTVQSGDTLQSIAFEAAQCVSLRDVAATV